jgi:hypothetical protein
VAEMAHVRLTINGHPYEGHCKPRKLLSISCKSISGSARRERERARWACSVSTAGCGGVGRCVR